MTEEPRLHTPPFPEDINLRVSTILVLQHSISLS